MQKINLDKKMKFNNVIDKKKSQYWQSKIFKDEDIIILEDNFSEISG